MTGRIEDDAPWAFELPVQATLRDTDGLGHVNNAVYVTWFEEIRTRYVFERRGLTRLDQCDFVLAATSVQFRSPVYCPETVLLRCRPGYVGTSSWEMHYEGRIEPGGRLVVEGSSVQVQYDFARRVKAPIPHDWRAILEADARRPS